MSVIVDIADAVVDALNVASFSPSFTATRSYQPIHELQDLDTLRVTVVPTGLALTRLDRARHMHEYIIDIGIQQRIPAATTTTAGVRVWLDDRMALVQSIADLFRNSALAAVPAASCIAVANSPVFAPSHLDDQRVFTSIVSLTYNLPR